MDCVFGRSYVVCLHNAGTLQVTRNISALCWLYFFSFVLCPFFYFTFISVCGSNTLWASRWQFYTQEKNKPGCCFYPSDSNAFSSSLRALLLPSPSLLVPSLHLGKLAKALKVPHATPVRGSKLSYLAAKNALLAKVTQVREIRVPLLLKSTEADVEFPCFLMQIFVHCFTECIQMYRVFYNVNFNCFKSA